MFIFLIILAIVLAVGAIIGIVTLVRAYRRGISRAVFTAAIICIIMLFGVATASALGAVHVAKEQGLPVIGNNEGIELVDVDDVPQEELIPNVDQLVDLNQIVIDDQFGDYSRYVLRSSWPNLAKVRTHYSGFSDAVSLPMAVDQAWFDAYQQWGPHGQTVSNPDGSTTVIGSYDDINAALKARQKYLDGLSDEDLLRYYREQIYNEILRNPIYGDMVARFFLEDELITANNQEWLQEFVDRMDAAYAAPDDQAQGIECWIQYDPNHPGDSKYLMTTDAYYQYAARLCLILEYYLDKGVSSPATDKHYCLPLATEVTKTRTQKADYSESEKAYILVYKTKDGRVADCIGFNLLDRRIERPQATEPKAEPTPTDAPDASQPDQPGTTPDQPSTTPDQPDPDPNPDPDPGKDPDPTPTPKPDPTPTPKPDPTPEPTKPVKDPADDPAQQGNANIGGGANQPSDGKGEHQDYETEKSQNQDYKPENNTGNRGDTSSSHETVTDSQGGHTDNGTPPDTSQPKDPEQAAPATGTETTVTDNGDGTTTTTTTEADASQETADGVLAMPD